MIQDHFLTDVIQKEDFKDAEHFFSSVERNYKKIRFIDSYEHILPLILSLLTMIIFSILANLTILYILGKSIFDLIEEKSDRVSVPLISFIAGLFVFVLAALILFAYLENKLRNKIGKDKIAFCWLFNCIKELESYLYNSDNTHLIKSYKLFNQYLNASDFNFEYYVKSYVAVGHDITETKVLEGKYIAYFLESIKTKYDWIEFTEKTVVVLDSLGKIHSKLTLRIKQGIEVKEVTNILVRLLLFEKAKFRPPFKTPENLSINYRAYYFNDFIELIKPLTELNNKLPSKFSKASTKANKYLFSENIIVNFFIWYFIIQIALLVPIIPTILYFKLKVDSTLIVGLTTTPILATVGLIGFTYRRNK